MRYLLFCVPLALAMSLAGAPPARPTDGPQPAKDKAAPAPEAAADVTFADGSTVRVGLVAQSLELETKYGKLTIPAADVRRIEFAFRLSEEVARKVKDAVGRLAENSFDEREAAMKDLRQLGLSAYPALEGAAKSKDAEVARRAAQLLAEIREKVSADKLHFPKQDRVQTAEFTVTGRLTSPTLKAKTAYFGTADLKLTDLRVLAALSGGGEYRVAVDAAKHGSATNQWLETTVTLERDTPLRITAGGQVDLWPQGPGQYMTTAKGYGNVAPPAFSAGSLVAKVGEGGAPFLVGERYDGKAPGSGKLYLHIIPSHWGNASAGTYDVTITTGER